MCKDVSLIPRPSHIPSLSLAGQTLSPCESLARETSRETNHRLQFVKTDAASDQKLGDGKAWEGADWSHSQAKVDGMGMRLYSMWAGNKATRTYCDYYPPFYIAFYWSCTLAGVHDAKERDLMVWDIPNRKR